MGRRGPKPKPTELAKRDGTFRADRHADAPDPAHGKPECPAHLSPAARAEYDRLCATLESMGILYESDRGAIAACAVLWARWEEAEAKITELGAVIRSPSGYPVQNPYLGIANKALTLLKAYYQQFGLTPSARAGLKIAGKEPEDDLLAMIRHRYEAPADSEAPR